jgi:TolB protein
MAGACEDEAQEASDARTGTPSVTVEPDASGQTLSIVDVDSGTETPFAAPQGASEFEVTLDGSMIAYTETDKNGDAQVFVMDADGTNARQLTYVEGGVYPGAIWSPDGSMIAYIRDTSDNTQMFVVSLSNGVSTQVTREPRGAVDPGGWAPDGGSIVFSSLNAAGNHYTARSADITTGDNGPRSGGSRLIVADGSTPTLSPDGAWIAFNSWLKPDPLVQLILAKSDGSERRVVARLNGDDGYQRWSPDSTQIAFVGTTEEEGFGTYVYDLAAGDTRFVTAGTIESWMDDAHILVS